MRVVHLVTVVALCIVSGAFRSRRLRRQTLPSQHVQVHSLDSNVMYNDKIYVESTESRIDVNERNLNGSIWSDHSMLNFDNQDTFVNVSADNAESYLSIRRGANMHAQSTKTNMYLHTNRTQDGETALSQSLLGDAMFSIDDDTLRVQAVKGKRIAIEALTWERSIEKKMVLSVDPSQTERDLRLEAIGNSYHVLATFSSSIVFIHFADKIIMIDPTYRIVEIFTDKFNVTVQAKDVPYDITLTQEQAVINLPTQRTRVCVTLEGVSVRSNHVAKTHVERGGGQMTVGGKAFEDNGAMILSKSTDLELNNAGQINADMENSRVYLDNNVQTISLTSGHHNVKIDHGSPHITVDPGEACIDIVANRGMPHFGELIPPFRPPPDKFGSIGPFPGDPRAENEFMNRPSCCSSIKPIDIPSDLGRPREGFTRTPTNWNPEWSEWGNNGNNGGWGPGPSGNSWSGWNGWKQPSNEGGGGGNPWATWENGGRPSGPAGGVNVDWNQPAFGTRGPLFGSWPTFSPLEDNREVTRGSWPGTFVTRNPGKDDWEKETGCVCQTKPGDTWQQYTPRPTEPLPEITRKQETPPAIPETTPTNAVTHGIPTPPPIITTPEVVPQTLPPILTNTTPTPPQQTQPQPTTSVSLEVGTTMFPTNEWSGGAGSVENTDAPVATNKEVSASTVTTAKPQTTKIVGGTQESPLVTMGPDDFAFAHYASTLYPEEIPLSATVSTVNVITQTPTEDGFPLPQNIATSQVNTTEDVSEWTGGASSPQDENATEHFPRPSTNIPNISKRSPLILKLRVPRGVDTSKVDISKSVMASLKKIIQGVARRRIKKRALENEKDIKINSVKSRDDTIEVEFDVNTVNEGDLLSLTSQEISQYFEFPVVSLERVEEFGDNRMIYIFIALGAVLLTLFCVCWVFQSIVKQMSKSLLSGVSRHFSTHPDNQTTPTYLNTGSSY